MCIDFYYLSHHCCHLYHLDILLYFLSVFLFFNVQHGVINIAIISSIVASGMSADKTLLYFVLFHELSSSYICVFTVIHGEPAVQCTPAGIIYHIFFVSSLPYNASFSFFCTRLPLRYITLFIVGKPLPTLHNRTKIYNKQIYSAICS